MKTLSVSAVGLAAASISAVLYVGCALTMLILPEETFTRFVNSLLHGLDVSTVMRHEVPLSDTVVGAIAWFVIGGILGLIFAAVYNLRVPSEV